MPIKMLSEYPLLNRMLLYIFLFATGTTALITFANLHSEYNRQLDSIKTHLSTIQVSQLKSLTNNIWTVNKESLKIQLNSMLQHPDIVFEEIVYPDGTVFSVGKMALSKEKYIVKEFKLNFNDYGKTVYLGKFRIYASTENIKDYLFDKLPRIITSNIFIITFVCGFISFLFILLFNRHLNRIANFTKTLDLNSLDNHLHLMRKQKDTSHPPDELEKIVQAINQMRLRLKDGIRQRENTELILRESEEKFRLIFTHSPLAVVHLDKDGIIKTCNDNLSVILGASQETLMGFSTLRSIVDQNMKSAIAAALSGKDSYYQGNYLSVTGGITTPIQARFAPLLTSDGSISGAIGILIDITEQKQTEKNLADEKERLAVTLRSIGDGVITTDISGNVILLNKVAEELTGWGHQEAVGHPLEEVFHIISELTGEQCENPVTKVIGSGQTVGLANHTVLVAKDGRKLSIADSGAPILDTESNIIGVVLVFRDVTEQIKNEKEMHKIKKLESIGVLAGGIAHDFNNILAAILGNINLALFDTTLNDRTKELLESAEKASTRAKDLTQQLLTFAKGGEPVKEVSSLKNVIKDSASFVLHGDKVACRYDIPEDLWLVDIDKGQMSQVIQNIVLNASHAMPEGGVIKIKCENSSSCDALQLHGLKKRKSVKIYIQDNGIGMTANVAEKIFDPYYTTKQEGSGLGLAISQSILIKHQGNIRVESSPGVGTLFTICLPASEKTKPQKQKSFAKKKISFQANILIMDDDAMLRNVAKEMLATFGHEVALAADGEEAVKLYQKSMNSGKFDLVIMDLTIPGGMGGKEAVQKVLDIDPAAKVIVSSGYSNDPIMANFKDFGFCSAIVKPYRLQELSKLIDQVFFS
ncbi:MAG: PAS domain S-box protein [Desulfobacula sp.]|nr:PAS domain S-box protein [Desulfobacula sp.]